MIQFDSHQNTITLSTRSTSYQMKVDSTGVLLHTYYGQKLRGGDLSRLICPEDRGFSPNPDEVGLDRTWSLDTQPQEYSSSGVGDFRLPCLEADLADGSHIVDLRYVCHTVSDGKYTLEGLPAFYDEGVTAQTLTVELQDKCSGLTVELLYGVLEEYDMITRTVRVRNDGPASVRLTRVSSACLDFPVGNHDFITLGGAYAREREPVRGRRRNGDLSVCPGGRGEVGRVPAESPPVLRRGAHTRRAEAGEVLGGPRRRGEASGPPLGQAQPGFSAGSQ